MLETEAAHLTGDSLRQQTVDIQMIVWRERQYHSIERVVFVFDVSYLVYVSVLVSKRTGRCVLGNRGEAVIYCDFPPVGKTFSPVVEFVDVIVDCDAANQFVAVKVDGILLFAVTGHGYTLGAVAKSECRLQSCVVDI